VKAGEQLHVRDYATDVSWRPVAFTGSARVGHVAAAFEAGATVVLQGLHLNWTPLAVFSRELEARLGQPVQTNAYLTPRNSQGLPVHHDTHDVFVLQVSGHKRWLVYEPALELPLRDQRYTPELGAPGDPVLDLVLGPGDTLYLPRGWLHEALTSDEDSLHLTVGVNTYTWLEALRAALDRASAEEIDLRRAVPPDGGGAEELLDLLADRAEPDAVRAAARHRFVRTRRPVLTDQLSQLRRLEDVTVDTVVERRPTVIADLDGAELRFDGKSITWPPQAEEAIAALVEADEPLRPRDLPGTLDDAGRLVLVRRLVREGFLRLAEDD
jgi:bifunctional lysine-specific demethylase and histidyl-hydroxylase NO66